MKTHLAKNDCPAVLTMWHSIAETLKLPKRKEVSEFYANKSAQIEKEYNFAKSHMQPSQFSTIVSPYS